MLKSLMMFSLPIAMSATVFAQQTWTQKVELQPSVERGSAEPVAEKAKSVIEDSAFSGGAVPKWIWGANNDVNYVVRKSVELKNVKGAWLRASCDNACTVFINGKPVGKSSEWQSPMDVDVTASLVDGTNVLEAEIQNEGSAAGFVFKLVVKQNDGNNLEVVSDDSWRFGAKRGDELTEAVQLRGTYGDGPWGQVFDNAAIEGRVPAGTFELLPGFQVEKLFTVPKDELGSWVCITFDHKGRLLASDQEDKGIYRITLPPVSGRAAGRQPSEANVSASKSGTSESGASESQEVTRRADALPLAEGETRVERLDFSKCEIKPTGAQGMLWAFDSLYFSINGGPGSGLYRARDKDGDEQFDECVKLKEFRGGGEHGPHALRLSPDGKRIFVICGNHTLPPFNPGEELTNKDYTSRVPTNWAEDHLLPRMWDANGHAVGILAPGGWIASTDPDGKTWDIFSIGYRNPYDMAFNADGELFAYDADMEWDVGMPWYRPTRVVHATSGSEFGWRSGSGKWPNHYIDSLPPMVNIGPGSPVGVEFGYGLKFPAKYQKALYICDWTFGTMYAIHTEPHMSTYKATKEEFVSRTPLPLTDVAAGPDGALYFSIGGGGTQSELFRVVYAGGDVVDPIDGTNDAGRTDRLARRNLEEFQQQPIEVLQELREKLSSGREQKALRLVNEAILEALQDGDRHQVMAAIRAIQRLDGVPIANDRMSVSAQCRFLVAWVTGLRADAEKIDDRLGSELQVKTQGLKLFVGNLIGSVTKNPVNEHERLELLRLASLSATRLNMQADEFPVAFQDWCQSLFPSNDESLNRELCQMLVYLKSPTVIEKTVKLLEAPSKPTVTDDMKDLLARNRGYAGDILRSIEKAPDQQQIWYAFCLRNLKDGWTMDQRKAYFAWFERAHTWAGGASFHGFLRNIEKECFENASEKERLLIEASGARKPYTLPEIPKPAGPGKDWTLEEVRALAKDGLKDRNFENGQKMFAATRCVICHRFAGDGGATGPDLTQLAGRFNLNDLTEAIMVPSKVISDQYKGSTIVTTDGKSFSGRIVADHDDTITILTNPEDPTKITKVAKADIEETQPFSVSIMPMDLLKPLNQDEVLDLLAYLLSRGDQGNGMFKR